MGIRQLLLTGSGGPQTLRELVATLAIGYDGYENPDPPPVVIQNYYGWGEIYLPFGFMEPIEYGSTMFTSFIVEEVTDSGSFSSLSIGRTGPDASSVMYPTINEYPMVGAAGITGSLALSSTGLNLPLNLFSRKYYGNSVTVRFALRTDIINAAGTGSVTVPTGATRAVIYALGGGGGGARVASGATRRGGGNGAIVKSDIVVSSAQWGTSLSYSVGVGGTGRVSSAGNGTAGGATTVTHAGLGVSISAGGGGGATTTANGTGGTASGGNVSNTSGSAGTSVSGLNPEQDAAFFLSHQGGGGGVAANGQNGLAGLVAIVWY